MEQKSRRTRVKLVPFESDSIDTMPLLAFCDANRGLIYSTITGVYEDALRCLAKGDCALEICNTSTVSFA